MKLSLLTFLAVSTVACSLVSAEGPNEDRSLLFGGLLRGSKSNTAASNDSSAADAATSPDDGGDSGSKASVGGLLDLGVDVGLDKGGTLDASADLSVNLGTNVDASLDVGSVLDDGARADLSSVVAVGGVKVTTDAIFEVNPVKFLSGEDGAVRFEVCNTITINSVRIFTRFEEYSPELPMGNNVCYENAGLAQGECDIFVATAMHMAKIAVIDLYIGLGSQIVGSEIVQATPLPTCCADTEEKFVHYTFKLWCDPDDYESSKGDP